MYRAGCRVPRAAEYRPASRVPRPAILLATLALLATSVLEAKSELVEVRSRAEIERVFSPAAKIRVVNLWATWCAPCIAEMPDLQAVDHRFSDREVQFVGVSLDDAIPGSRAERKALVRKFLSKRKISFRNVYYLGNVSRLADEYDYSAEIPITFIFDQTGKELMRYQGVIDRETLTADLKRILKK